MDVLYTCDNRYLDIMLGSIISLISNSQIENLCIHIISANYRKEDYQKIDRVFQNHPNVTYQIYPLECYNIEKYQIPNWRDTQIANARLFFTDIMKDQLPSMDHLLYLDSDTNVVGDLSSLQDFENMTIGACKDVIILKALEKYHVPMYYNSGVLLINIDRWMEEECDKRLLEEIRNPHTELNYPDQDIINIALKDNIKPLPIQFNLTPYEYLFNSFERRLFFNPKVRYRSYQEVEEALENPKIYHGCGLASIKPWSNNKVNPFNEAFMKTILEANPDFEMERLSEFQRLLDNHPLLLRKSLILRTYAPQFLNDLVSEFSMKKQGISSKQYRK